MHRPSASGDQRDHASDDGAEGFLQPGEAGRVYDHRRHPDDGGDDPPGRGAQRHPPETEATLQHLQLHAAVERLHRQDLPDRRQRILRHGSC